LQQKRREPLKAARDRRLPCRPIRIKTADLQGC
jgi:hypothetical protein